MIYHLLVQKDQNIKKGKDLIYQIQPSHLQISLSRNRHTSSRGGGSNSFFFIKKSTCGFARGAWTPCPHLDSCMPQITVVLVWIQTN